MSTGTIAELLEILAVKGGAAVSSDKYSEAQLFHARATKRFYVAENGYGYVWESEYWRKIAEEANGKRIVKPAELTEGEARAAEPAPKPTDTRQVCSPESPMPKGASGRWAHTNVEEIDSYDGYPGGDIAVRRCKDCGHRWKEELPQ